MMSVREYLKRPVTNYQVLVVLIVAVTMAGAALLISLRANDVSERRERAARLASEMAWCDVIVTVDESFRAAPPVQESGKKLARGMADLRARNCPPQSINAPLPSLPPDE